MDNKKTFIPEIIANASKAGEGLCKWVKAIHKYHFVYKAIMPLREDLDKATKSLKDATEELNKKRAFLEECEKKCRELNEYF